MGPVIFFSVQHPYIVGFFCVVLVRQCECSVLCLFLSVSVCVFCAMLVSQCVF